LRASQFHRQPISRGHGGEDPGASNARQHPACLAYCSGKHKAAGPQQSKQTSDVQQTMQMGEVKSSHSSRSKHIRFLQVLEHLCRDSHASMGIRTAMCTSPASSNPAFRTRALRGS
jgi:hypothetical protein